MWMMEADRCVHCLNLINQMCLPFETDACEREDGADDRYVLHVVDELAHSFAERPAERKPLGQLQDKQVAPRLHEPSVQYTIQYNTIQYNIQYNKDTSIAH